MTPTSEASPEQPFRILSLDGGGIMGAFPASALATFERATGRRIVEHFDLITGTSTGGIIAIGLAMGASMEEITRFYQTEGPKIFPQRTGSRRGSDACGTCSDRSSRTTPSRGHQGGRRGPTTEGGEDATGDPVLRRQRR